MLLSHNVVKSLVRYLTSFVGALAHTVAGMLSLNPLLILLGGLGLKYGVRGVWHAEFALLSMDMGRPADRGRHTDSGRASVRR
jgi:hypothetical protein